MKNNRSKNTFSEKSFFMMLREMIPLYLRYIKCTIGISLDFWIFEVHVVGYVMLFGVIGSFLRIQPEMLGFGIDRNSRVHTSTKIFGKLLGTQYGRDTIALGQNVAKNLGSASITQPWQKYATSPEMPVLSKPKNATSC